MSDLHRYYQRLDLDLGASQDAVNQAYKDLAFIWHPDRIPEDNPRLKEKAQAKLQELNEARQFFREHFRSQRNGEDPETGDRPSEERPPSTPWTRQRRPSAATSRGGRNGNPFYRPTENEGSPPNSNGPSKSAPRRPRDPQRNSPPAASRSARQTSQTSTTSPPRSQSPPPPQGSPAPAPVPSPQPRRSSRPPIVPPGFNTGERPSRRPGSDLSGADFRNANLKERDFSGRNLSGADLRGADLTDAFLHRVDLSGANLEGARLFRANLLQADLSDANLQGTNLISADLSGANLQRANLSGAKMYMGDRLMVRLTGAHLDGAIMPAKRRKSS